ncbi:MAG: hypothetical protein KF745_08735 [Phycisphaeraceae bacterium]|nr:hypothetical protein [Phycisphaeraceae bacterium]
MLNLPSSFNPSPDLAAKILNSVTDPTLTLRDVADLHHTTVEALILWFAEPEIAERLDQIESTIARRTRIVASNFLPAATIAMGRSIDEHNADESHFPVRPGDQRGLELRRRSRETARRAAALLLRLANFTPGPRRATDTTCNTPPRPPTPAPPSPQHSTALSPARPLSLPHTPSTPSSSNPAPRHESPLPSNPSTSIPLDRHEPRDADAGGRRPPAPPAHDSPTVSTDDSRHAFAAAACRTPARGPPIGDRQDLTRVLE